MRGQHDEEIWSILEGWLHPEALPAMPAALCPPPGSLGWAGGRVGVPVAPAVQVFHGKGLVCTKAPWSKCQGHRCQNWLLFRVALGFTLSYIIYQCLHLLSQLHFEVVKVIGGVVRISLWNTSVELFPSVWYLKWPLTCQLTVIHMLWKNNLFFFLSFKNQLRF